MRARVLIFVWSALLFLTLLGRQDIVTSHEARVALTARTMAESGWPWNPRPVSVLPVTLQETPDGTRMQPDYAHPGNAISVNPWLIPVLNGQIRLQKPPLPYWCAALAYRVAGMSEAAARFFPALLGALSALILYDLARRLGGRTLALYSVLAWLSTHFIIDEFRKAMADPYLAFFALAALWAWIAGSRPAASSRPRSGWWIVAFYAAMTLGLLAKGPPLLPHILLGIAALHLCLRRRAAGNAWQHVLGITLTLGIAALWPAYILRHIPNALELWKYESIGELSGQNVEKARNWHLYLVLLPVMALPWLGPWILGLAAPIARFCKRASRASTSKARFFWKGDRDWPALFPILWIILVVGFFSLSSVKKPAYLLPLMPAMALVMAFGARTLLAAARKRVRFAKPIIAGQAIAGLIAAFVLAAALLLEPLPAQPKNLFASLRLHVTPTNALLALGVLIVGTAPLLLLRSSRNSGAGTGAGTAGRGWLVTQSIAYSALIFVFLNGVNAPADNARSPRAFSQIVADLAQRPGWTLSTVRPQEAAWFYLPESLRYDPAADHVLVIIEARSRMARMTLDADFFRSDVPGRPVASFREIPVPTATERNRWRLYEVVVRSSTDTALPLPAR